MRFQIALLILVTALIGGAVSISASQEPSTNQSLTDSSKGQQLAPPTRVISEADNNNRITLTRRDLLAVRLAANPSTGYSWQLGSDPKPLVLQSTQFEPTNSDRQMPGSPEVQVLRFKANGAGSAVLLLEYRRPWEKNVAPAKTFRVEIAVQ